MAAVEYPRGNADRVPIDIGPHAFAVTPSDDADLPYFARSIIVGGAGDVAVVTRSGESLTFTLAANTPWYFVQIARIKDTGTDATGIIAAP